MTEPHQFSQDRNPADYVCQCFGLFEGKFCEVPYMNCGDGRRCYNGGVCRQSTSSLTKSATTTAVCDCPSGFGGPTCQSPQSEATASDGGNIDGAARGAPGRKAGTIFGILFAVAFLIYSTYRVIKWCCVDDYSVVTEEELDEEIDFEDDDISMKTSKWRNIV